MGRSTPRKTDISIWEWNSYTGLPSFFREFVEPILKSKTVPENTWIRISLTSIQEPAPVFLDESLKDEKENTSLCVGLFPTECARTRHNQVRLQGNGPAPTQLCLCGCRQYTFSISPTPLQGITSMDHSSPLSPLPAEEFRAFLSEYFIETLKHSDKN